MKQKLLVIIGPTASKKTTLAHKIALALKGSIINADAFQVYQEINYGVNKPSVHQQQEVPYYLLNILNAHQAYDIVQFQKDVQNAIQDITQQQRMPILVGGSHLYIHAIINNYNLVSKTKRNDYQYNHLTNQELFNLVYQYDAQIAQQIGQNNRQRLLRYADFASQKILNLNQNCESLYETLIIMTNIPRKQLYEHINERFNNLVQNSLWLQEVTQLLQKDPQLIHSNGFKAIGYREIGNYVLYQTPIDFNLIQKKIRNLAKTQLTWCNNKFPQKIIFNYYLDNIDSLIEIIQKWYNQ